MRRVLGILAVLALAGACGSSTATPSPATPSPDLPPETAWQRALADVDEDGRYSREAALALFATAFGPIPGVDVERDLTGVDDMTMAIIALRPYRDELTDEQRAAFDAAIRPPEGAVRITIPEVARAGGARLAVMDSTAMQIAIREMATTAREQIAQRIGFDIEGEVNVIVPPMQDGNDWRGMAWAYDEDGNLKSCDVTIFPRASEGDTGGLRRTVTHELFHCFQFTGFGHVLPEEGAPAWIMEGQAEWVGGVLQPAPRPGWWRMYLTRATFPLVERSYDAVGFYAHLAETGIDPWTTFDDMWAVAGNNIDAFRAAGADNPRFLQSWASGLTREAIRGLPWDTSGPAITGDAYMPRRVAIAGGTDVPLGVPFFTNEVLALSVTADLLHVTFEGDARLNDGSYDTTELDDAWFCIAGHDCAKECPNKPPPPATQATIRPTALLAMTGGVLGGVGHARGIDLDTCESPSPAVELCSSGCGKALGDVHIVTVSGGDYDFQAAGEFVLARSVDGSLEVQVRLEPLGRGSATSINTAVAVRVGDSRVAVYADLGRGALGAKVDARDVAGTGPVDLGAGNRLVREGDGFRVDLADGGSVYVLNLPYRGLNAIVRPSPAALAGLSGLVAPVAAGSDLPPLPDGTAVPAAMDRLVAFQNVYRTFADAWRVTPATSLFDYAPGESTETFTNRAFPHESELRLLGDLTAEERAAGEKACAGVRDAIFRAMCIYDVGVTADAGWGSGYEHTIELLETGSIPASDELVRVVNLYANESGPIALDVYAWADPPSGSGEAQAAPLGTVPYGTAGAFVDPGTVTGSVGRPSNRISIQRSGEPLRAFQLNLIDLEREGEPGAVRTLVVSNGDPASFSVVGGRPARSSELYEARPTGYPLAPATADGALLFANIDALYYDRPDSDLYVAAGDGCLTMPDFPTVPQRFAGLPGSVDLALVPGDRRVTIHEASGNPAPGCTTPSTVAPVPVAARAGERYHLFVYQAPGEPGLRTLVVPFRG